MKRNSSESDGNSCETEPFQDSGSEYAPSETSNEADIKGISSDWDDVNHGAIRKKNEANWKRNIRKRMRAAGEKYIDIKGRVVPGKTFEAEECTCSKKCHEKFSQEWREALHKNFYSLGSHTLQTSYIFGQIRVQNKESTYSTANLKPKEHSRFYFLPNGNEKSVCKTFFKISFGVSDGRITRALKTKNTTGTPQPDMRGKSSSVNKTALEKVAAVKRFINKFPVYESHYSRTKNPNVKYLSPELDITKMYTLYKSETEDPVSIFVFRKIFKTDFNLKFHAPVSDSCLRCDAFNIKIKAAMVDDQEYKTIKMEQELHQRKAEAARQGMKNDAEAAKLDNDLTVISFDLMKTLATPIISTGVAYYKRQLWTFCFGIHDLHIGIIHMYMWDESITSRGSQEIGSCILHFIKNYVTTKKLIMYSNQCGGQNRNFKMAAFCTYITSSNDYKVEIIDHKFLVSGHSYLPNDQDFGLIEKNKKHYKNIYVPSDWVQVVLETKKKNPFRVVIMKSIDFVSSKGLEKGLTNRKNTEDNEKVEWLRIQWLRYEKEKPGIIQYKYSNNESVLFNAVNVKKRGTQTFKQLAELLPLYERPKNIQGKKYKDLLSLRDYVPPVHHEFYRQLVHSAHAEDQSIFEDCREEEAE